MAVPAQAKEPQPRLAYERAVAAEPEAEQAPPLQVGENRSVARL